LRGLILERSTYEAALNRSSESWSEQADTTKSPTRTNNSQITFFDNLPGSGIQLAAVANLIYEKAKARHLRLEIPTDWFLQDIRD